MTVKRLAAVSVVRLAAVTDKRLAAVTVVRLAAVTVVRLAAVTVVRLAAVAVVRLANFHNGLLQCRAHASCVPRINLSNSNHVMELGFISSQKIT